MATSSTGGFLLPTNTNGYLTQPQLEDLLQSWVVGITGS